MACLLSVVAQQTHELGDGWIVGRNHPTLAGSHIFGRVERKTACAKAANRLLVYLSRLSLAGIFDQSKTVCCVQR